MARVKRGTIAQKRRKHLLRHTKGFRWTRKSKYRMAKEAMLKAWKYAFRDRRTKKREFRQLWETNLGAALRTQGISYSRFINLLKKQNIELDRKVLATLANTKPALFKMIVEKVRALKSEKS